GAARELKDAILINPFDTEGFADAIFSAVKMSEKERKRRVKKMQKVVLENNIYKWAGTFILQLSEL
ncbi:MAG: trehalose-6-phosphate synthase, partial [Elusimicrobiota bacterium]|nr:trehalose-6-phosphate synthase [Elusimicrobiota bacterium]